MAAIRFLIVVALAPLLGAAQCIVTVVGPVNIEGGPATSMSLFSSYAVVPDGTDGLWLADYNAHAIRYVNATTGGIRTVAGTYRTSGKLATTTVSIPQLI